MADGVDVDIIDGTAHIDFVEPGTRDTYLAKLIELGGPNAVTVDTGGTHRTYIVAEDIAEAAGLVDKAKPKRSTRKSK